MNRREQWAHVKRQDKQHICGFVGKLLLSLEQAEKDREQWERNYDSVAEQNESIRARIAELESKLEDANSAVERETTRAAYCAKTARKLEANRDYMLAMGDREE